MSEDCVPQNARGDVTPAADGDHEVRLEVIEDLVCRLLAELVNLGRPRVSVNATQREFTTWRVKWYHSTRMHASCGPRALTADFHAYSSPH